MLRLQYDGDSGCRNLSRTATPEVSTKEANRNRSPPFPDSPTLLNSGVAIIVCLLAIAHGYPLPHGSIQYGWIVRQASKKPKDVIRVRATTFPLFAPVYIYI